MDSAATDSSPTDAIQIEAAAVPARQLAVQFAKKPNFRPLKAHEISDGQIQFRKVPVPPHRYIPLKKAWLEIYTPIYEEMKIDIRMNLTARRMELETRSETPDLPDEDLDALISVTNDEDLKHMMNSCINSLVQSFGSDDVKMENESVMKGGRFGKRYR